MLDSKMSFGGTLSAVVMKPKSNLKWKIQNSLRPSFMLGWLYRQLATSFSKLTGIPTIVSDLSIRVHRAATNTWEDYGIVSYRVVTDAGVAFMVDDWDVNTASATNDITTLRYHGAGTGSTAESAGDTALVTESTTALNPDSTRATGTQSQPSANILRSVGTLTFDATAAIVEHGLFSQAATGGGTLWDRSVFSAINVVSGDSIQFTYNCTLTSGS